MVAPGESGNSTRRLPAVEDRGCCLGRFGRIQDTEGSLKARKASEVYYPPLLIRVGTNTIAFGNLESIKQYDVFGDDGQGHGC